MKNLKQFVDVLEISPRERKLSLRVQKELVKLAHLFKKNKKIQRSKAQQLADRTIAMEEKTSRGAKAAEDKCTHLIAYIANKIIDHDEIDNQCHSQLNRLNIELVA